MAKRFTKMTINWAELEKRVPPDQKANFFAFKAKSIVYIRKVESNPPEPPKIDWEDYKKIVPVPGLVDKIKSAYESFKVPYPEDKYSSKVDEQWKALEPQIKAYCSEIQKDIEIASKELQRIKALPPYEDMTMEMYNEMFPDLALDPVKKPTFWPHTPDEQLGYVDPTIKVEH